MAESRRADRGNSGGRTEFVMESLEKYEQPLTRYVMRLMSGDLAAARDVVQHAFLKMCEIDYRTIEDHAAPWLYRVCRNRSVDLIRGRNKEEQLEQPDIQPGRNGFSRPTNPASIAEQQDFVQKLQTLINDLPDGQREIVELWSHGFNSQEVGEIIGKRSGAVRISLHRAIKQLRSHESVRRWLGEKGELPTIVSPLSDRFRQVQ